jgi:hypothetical protein
MIMIGQLAMRPPILQLTLQAFLIIILVGAPFLKDKCFIAFLGDPWAKHLEGLYIGFYLLPNNNPSRPSAPSSHRMRDNPFLGQYTLKSQEIRKWRQIVMESGKYGQEQYDGSSREFVGIWVPWKVVPLWLWVSNHKREIFDPLCLILYV